MFYVENEKHWGILNILPYTRWCQIDSRTCYV